MEIDIHVHTTFSHQKILLYDGVNTPEEMVNAAKRKGLDAFFITDHDTMEGYERVKGEFVFPGEEVSTVDGHVLALGIQEPIPPGLSLEETIDRIHEQGGLAVAAHPFGALRSSLGSKIAGQNFDAIEAFNSLNLDRISNYYAFEAAKILGLPALAGSDAHSAEMLGKARVIVDAEDLDEVLKKLKKGKFSIKTEYVKIYELIKWARRRGELSRAYTFRVVNSWGIFAPVGWFFLSLLYLPEFTDLVYWLPSRIVLELVRIRRRKTVRKEFELFLRRVKG